MKPIDVKHIVSAVGAEVGPFSEHFDSRRISEFNAAVGWTQSAPPFTLFTICRRGEFEILQSLGIPISRVLHAEQEYEYLTPLSGGAIDVRYSTKLLRATEKKQMTFLVFESLISVGPSFNSAVLVRSTMVVKQVSS